MPSAATIIASVAMNGCSRPATIKRPLSEPSNSATQGVTSSTPSTPNLVGTCEMANHPTTTAVATPSSSGIHSPCQRPSAISRRRPTLISRPRASPVNTKRARNATATKPTAAAAGTPMMEAAVQPALVSSMAQTMVENPITEPTDRSMPPSRITMVIPVATRPVIETWRSTSVRLP